MMLQPFAILLVLTLHLSFVVTQNFNVPTNWRKPTSMLSRSDRLGLLDGLLNTISQTFDSSTGLFSGLTDTQTANMLCALAIGDSINSSTTSKDLVVSSLDTTFTLFPNITNMSFSEDAPNAVNDNRAIWGLAAIHAYKAYGEPTSLRYAQSMWDQLSVYLITSEGAPSFKTANISSTCNGSAVFANLNDPNNLLVNGATTAGFLALSAHLYEQTSTSRYLSAANLSAFFIVNHLYKAGAIMDQIDLGTCDLPEVFVTYNSGYTIEGLSVLVDAASGVGSQYQSFLSNLVATAVVSTHWTNSSDGIIFEGPTADATDTNSDYGTVALKAMLIRGLYQAYTRNLDSVEEAKFIRSFITVQFNALLDLASAPGRGLYSPRWEGPPPTSLLPWGQVAAIDVLISAVGFADSQNSSVGPEPVVTPSSSGTSESSIHIAPSMTETSPPISRDKPVGVIIGIAISVIFILLILFVAVLLLLRRKRSRYTSAMHTLENSSQAQESNSTDDFDILTQHNGSRSSLERLSQSRALVPMFLPDSPPDIANDTSVGVLQHSEPIISHNTELTRKEEPSSAATSAPGPGTDRDRHVVGHTTEEASRSGHPAVDLAAFPNLFERLMRIAMSDSLLENTEQEAPPRYEE